MIDKKKNLVGRLCNALTVYFGGPVLYRVEMENNGIFGIVSSTPSRKKKKENAW